MHLLQKSKVFTTFGIRHIYVVTSDGGKFLNSFVNTSPKTLKDTLQLVGPSCCHCHLPGANGMNK